MANSNKSFSPGVGPLHRPRRPGRAQGVAGLVEIVSLD